MHLLTNTVKIFKLSQPTNLRSDVGIKIVVAQVQESELGDVVNGGRYEPSCCSTCLIELSL